MRILVTGGAGYIGSVTAAELLEAGHDVVVYDNLSHGSRDAVPTGASFVQGDVADSDRLGHLFQSQRVDAVMHFAALIEAGESMRKPEAYFRNNACVALTLLEAMLTNNVNRLVFSSTAAVYGDPSRVPISESDPLVPTNPYGESKLIVERMLGWFARIHGLRYASLRYFNAAGASTTSGEQHHPETHLIPLLLEVAEGKRDHLSIFGTDYPTPDGTCIRDYVHVLDLSLAHLLALNALEKREHLVYNLGNGQGFSVREVVEAARRVTGAAIPVAEAPPRAGDPAVLVASSVRIKAELGWAPRYPDLDEIIASAWRWRQGHPGGRQRK